MDTLTLKIQKLTEKAGKLEAQRILRENALKNRMAVKERKDRDRQIYKLGGIVEKMGLRSLDEILLIGGLYNLHKTIETGTESQLQMIRKMGSSYLEVGKRMPPVKTRNG